MSATSDLSLLIGVTERLHPKVKKSKLWRRARNQALESVVKADYNAQMWHNVGVCESPLEMEELSCQEDDQSMKDLNDMLTKILHKQPQNTCTTQRISEKSDTQTGSRTVLKFSPRN